MTDVVICNPLRTPVGRMGGTLSTLTAADLATATLRALVEETGLGEGDVDDVVLGNGYPNGEAPAIGRIAALDAGLGTGVPGLQIDDWPLADPKGRPIEEVRETRDEIRSRVAELLRVRRWARDTPQ